MSRLQGLNTTLDILSASSGAVVGWFFYRVVVTSCKRQWTRGSKTEDEHGSSRRLLEERIEILKKENRTLYERTVALALENRLLYDRILQVAFVDEEEDVTHYTRDEDEDWSWCWWQEEEEEDMKNVYKTPEKNVGMRQTDEVQTPTQDNDTCVHHG